jgi:Tol biopolymer transport system component
VYTHVDFTPTDAVSVRTTRADGSKIRQITPDAMQAGSPDWSPDGNKIVFQDNVCPVCDLSDIWVMNANGKNMRRITRAFGNNALPHWSPDGRMIVFQNTPSVEPFVPQDIWTMNADGSGLFDVTQSPTNDSLADWGAA